MKKGILFIAFVGIFLWKSLVFSAHAKIFLENQQENKALFELVPNNKFNVLEGCKSEDYLEQGLFYHYYMELVEGHLIEGELYLNGLVTGDSGSKHIKATYYIENYKLVRYHVAFEEKVFYEFLVHNEKPTIILCKEVNLNELIGYSPSLFTLSCDFNFEYSASARINPDYVAPADYEIERSGFKCIFATTYSTNPIYESKKVHFIVDCENPLTFEQILSSIRVTDETEGNIPNVQVIDSTYEETQGYKTPGEYSFTLMARDTYGNTTVQECVVDVVDITPPAIQGKDERTSYVLYLDENYFLKRFTAEDPSGISYIKIVENTYAGHNHEPGIYTVTAEAADTYGNTARASIRVEIVDDRSPVITIDRSPIISTKDNYILDDFKQFLHVYDEIDGIITEYKVTDLDDYLNHKAVYGEYRFLVEAEDSSGNSIRKEFSVRVIDEDFPVIEVTDFTIVVDEGSILTMEQIRAVLVSAGQLQEDDEITLSSVYFEEENPSGSYSLIVTAGDKVFHNTIDVVAKEEKNHDYTVPSVPKKETFARYYILGGGIAVALLFLCGLSAVIWKKRH